MKYSPLLLLVLFLASCTLPPSVLIEDTTCPAPCWRGMTMGMEKEDAVAVLDEMEDISPGSVENSHWGGWFWDESISWEFANRKERWGVIFLKDQKINLLDFYFRNTLPLATYIKQYGEPDLVFIDKQILDGVMVTVKLIYTEKGICLVHEPLEIYKIPNPDKFRIKPSTKIQEVLFIDPAASEQQTQFGCMEGLSKEAQDEYVSNWKGYGVYPVAIQRPHD